MDRAPGSGDRELSILSWSRKIVYSDTTLMQLDSSNRCGNTWDHWKAQRVAIIGAGGAARAAVWALVSVNVRSDALCARCGKVKGSMQATLFCLVQGIRSMVNPTPVAPVTRSNN